MKETKKVKVYIDGGSRGNPGSGACASVIMNSRGDVIAEEGRYLGKCSNNFAEYSALHLALTVSKKLGATELDIFSDSELLVKQFNGEYRIKDERLREFMSIIKSETKNFREVRITHIKRELNRLADRLVNNILNSNKMSAKENRELAREREEKFKQSDLF